LVSLFAPIAVNVKAPVLFFGVREAVLSLTQARQCDGDLQKAQLVIYFVLYCDFLRILLAFFKIIAVVPLKKRGKSFMHITNNGFITLNRPPYEFIF
jgi:hypothetical protein